MTRVSRDHGWGPGFTVWFTKDDFDDYGEYLREVLDTLPNTFDGFRSKNPPARTCGVTEIGSYIESVVGFFRTPRVIYGLVANTRVVSV